MPVTIRYKPDYLNGIPNISMSWLSILVEGKDNDNILMYILVDDEQKCPFCGFKLLAESFVNST